MSKSSIRVTVIGGNLQRENALVAELQPFLDDHTELTLEAASAPLSAFGGPGQVVLVDGRHEDSNKIIETIDRRGRAVFLIVQDSREMPGALRDGKIDDILVYPFRRLELISKLNQYQQILAWDEVAKLNASFSELITGLHDDLKLAERLQKARLPRRFTDIKGFKAFSRYLAGMRSGGDYFDLAESKDRAQISIVLSDSSSYGLASAVLSVLMRVAMKLSMEEVRSSHETVKRIQQELVSTLGDKDHLSLFYGVISRADLSLRYTHLGSSLFFHAKAGSGFSALGACGERLGAAATDISIREQQLQLSSGDRLVILSDGFQECAGGIITLKELLDQFRAREAADCLNELVFKVKSKFPEEDSMPSQDCTALIIDVDQNVIRLTRGQGENGP